MWIDLNADLGEGFDDVDAALIEVVTSANVACGFHAGGEMTARAVCSAAAARGVAVGAHISYRDRAGFGRRELGVAPEVVAAEAAEQVGALAGWARSEGTFVSYVKPHGALYHRASVDAACADAIVAAAAADAGGLAVLALPGSELLARARAAGLAAVAEGFADRGYRPDGTLVPRGDAGAVLQAEEAVRQAVRLAREGAVGSLCVHGDTLGAAALAQRVRHELATAGIEVRPFA